jgi:membrane protein
VKGSHAWAGALFASAGIELAKNALAAWFTMAPTYSVVYGAFATLPILLVWIYVAWIIVLLGAVIAAYMPSLLLGVARQGGGPGWHFQLAVEALQQLHAALQEGGKGLTAAQLARTLQVDELALEPVLEALAELDWVLPLKETDEAVPPRHVLLADLDTTRLGPLARKLLVEDAEALESFWNASQMRSMRLRDVL